MDDRKRVSGRLAAIFIVIMLIAVPATATVITQNFMRVELSSSRFSRHLRRRRPGNPGR